LEFFGAAASEDSKNDAIVVVIGTTETACEEVLIVAIVSLETGETILADQDGAAAEARIDPLGDRLNGKVHSLPR
jgi:hypothetical protein